MKIQSLLSPMNAMDVPTTSCDPVAVFEKAETALRRKRRQRTLFFGLLFLLAVAGSCRVGEVSISQFIQGLPGLSSYMHDILPQIHAKSLPADLASWYWALGKWLSLLLDTILMAFLATLMGAVGAFCICFPASRNLVENYLVYFVCRRIMELARGVPDLVYALIFVFSFGLGALPGVIAIAIHSIGALGKLFSEVNENIDSMPIDGVKAAGGNWFQVMRYAVVPQVMPNFISYTLLRFEINVRAASVIGFVGAGGIGQELMFVIRQFIYTDISAIIILIIATVILIDLFCEALRHRIIGGQELL
jgi:phosphonate transport system permease protein